ncbi:hypothetical protein C9374_012032 [Naegleria lovaniensis]|uniref:Uncharacterized protein n=1 Tax=Naegleria lovaniensis TaxID=51637 RepID=A0AA88GDK8_NAELO|nr:uncharacterized protein C9374_012032 [Naegleria lovaniensis]KAG2373569.1 hypothetical protein C9374_012032 [Naegleria lovaniensis]
MIFGNVNSIEEKLCKQCAKLFDLWFTKALQVENSLKPLAGSSQSLRKSQQHHQTSHTISTSKPSRALHKTMMTSSFFTLRSRSVFREHNKRRSLPMRPPPMVVNQQLLQEWITDPNNNVWENPLDPTSDYLETIPQKYLAKHDLHQVDQEVELNDMIFDFLHVSKSSGSSSTKSKQDEPSGGNLYHSDDKDPARHENFNNKKTNRDEEEQRQAQSCTCCCLC